MKLLLDEPLLTSFVNVLERLDSIQRSALVVVLDRAQEASLPGPELAVTGKTYTGDYCITIDSWKCAAAGMTAGALVGLLAHECGHVQLRHVGAAGVPLPDRTVWEKLVDKHGEEPVLKAWAASTDAREVEADDWAARNGFERELAELRRFTPRQSVADAGIEGMRAYVAGDMARVPFRGADE